VPPAATAPPPAAPVTSPAWTRLAFGAVAVFATVLAAVTGVELAIGRPLSDVLRGDQGSGTTLFRDDAAQRQPAAPAPAPTVTKTVTPHVVVTTPTITQTAPAVTQTVAPPSAPTSATPTASPGATSGTGPASQPASP
jgi:hypothetical protein